MKHIKPPRRHNFFERTGLWLAYDLGITFRGLITIAFLWFGLVGCLMTLASTMWVISTIVGVFIDFGPDNRVSTASSLFFSGFFIASLIGDYILYRIIRIYSKLPKGHVLNPVRPDVEEVLPEKEVLVRASMPDNAATLLRASASSKEDAPQLLLRTSSGDTTE